MHEMKLAKVRCNDFTYNAAISAAGRAAQWQISLALLEEMTSAAVQASLFSYSACTSACQRSEHWEAALALFGGMENLRANHVVYNGVLRLVTVGVLHNKRPEPARTRGEPAGLSTEATLAATSTQLRGAVVTQVSRLDVPTSGALLAALGEQDSCGAWWLLAQFAGRLVSKVYCCLCHGEPPGEPPWHGEVNRPLKVTSVLGVSQATIVKEEDPQGKASCTKYEVLATFQSSNGGVFSLTQAQPSTYGQCWVALASTGLCARKTLRPEWCPSLFLHCWQLRFLSLDAEPHLLCAPLPPALRDALQHLTLRSGHVPAELCGVLCTGG
eukprot:g19466.t1